MNAQYLLYLTLRNFLINNKYTLHRVITKLFPNQMDISRSGKRKRSDNPASWQTLLERARRLADDLTDVVRRGPMLSILRELDSSLQAEVSFYSRSS